MEESIISHALNVLICATGWVFWCVLIGYVGNRLPLRMLDHDTLLTKPRPWGESTRNYQRYLAIRQWKVWLPDAGHAFPGGLRKKSLVCRNSLALQRLLAETRRAELVHLAIWPFWIVTLLWMPPLGVMLNLFFATAFNLPCLWVQRFNRLRLLKRLQDHATTQPACSRIHRPECGPWLQ